MGVPLAAQAAPPGVAKTTHVHLKRTEHAATAPYRGATEPRSPVLVFAAIPFAMVGTLAAVGGFGYVLAGKPSCDRDVYDCPSYQPKFAALVGVAGLAATGIAAAMIIIGAQRVLRTRPSATLAPWLGPNQGGLALQLKL